MIREAGIEHLDAIQRLEQECFEDPWNRRLIESELLATNRLNLVFLDDEIVAGYVLAMLIPEELHVNKIGVVASARRKGIARELMQTVAAVAAGRGCELISLEVRRSNDPGRRFYESLGFTIDYVRRRYYPNGDDALVMKRAVVN